MKITGQKAQIFIDSGSNTSIIQNTGNTIANTKYFVISKGTTSNIPVSVGMFFIAPRTGTQISLTAGDKIFRINEDRFCKTNASFELSQGTVDVSDDCQPSASILDGIVSFSGSLSGLFRYDEVSQEFDNVTEDIINKFLDVIEDIGTGTYTVHPRDDSQMYLLALLNSGTKTTGQFENWIFAPIIINSMSVSLGNSDPQSKDLSFTLGEGTPILYKVRT